MKNKAPGPPPSENSMPVSIATGMPMKTGPYVIGALCCLLLVSVVVLGINNSKLHGQSLQLSKEKIELQAEVDALSKEHMSDTSELKRMRQEKKDAILAQARIASTLRFYYDHVGILDGDGQIYYHRHGCNCPLLAAQDSVYIYNIEAMPRKSKPCPYCYSSSADLPINDARLEY
ncbi:MAG: hypothetical protein VB049_08365 [Candidatus Pelethousia sp.]|nr:hypothetical protein [Candidatus Pelethousia sp.]